MWGEEEIQLLRELFKTKTAREISLILNRTLSSVLNKGTKLGLKKDKEIIYENRKRISIKRNKEMGRDLTDEFLRECALKYKTRGEFHYHDSSAYTVARQKGIIDDICSHMAVIKFSIPQLILQKVMDSVLNSESMYNTRKIIPPYEIDVYYSEFNLGFEYDGSHWHKFKNAEERDIKKEIICKERNINIIKIMENSRKYEEDVKNQLIQNLNLINQITNKNINENDILNVKINSIYDKIYNKEDLINICKYYTSFTEFYKKEQKVYDKLRKIGLLETATSHMTDRMRIRKEGEIKEKISEYEMLGDLIKYDYSTYLWVKKNKREDLLKNLKYKVKFNKEYHKDYPCIVK
jgi:hypothetical protein